MFVVATQVYPGAVGLLWRASVATAVLLSVQASPPAQADCDSYFVAAYPASGAKVPTNFRIILDRGGDWEGLGSRSIGAGKTQGSITGLPPGSWETGAFALQGGDLVRLRVVDILRPHPATAYIGAQKQIVLAPERDLQPNTVYTLVECSSSGGFFLPCRVFTPRGSPFQWTTGGAPDHEPPGWEAAPAFLGHESMMFGCGPASWIKFSAEIMDDAGPVFVQINVTPEASPVQRALVPPKQQELRLGHGMCSGPFRFETGKRYRVELAALVDAAGNASGSSYSFELLGPALSPEFIASEEARLERRKWMGRMLVSLLALIVAFVGYVTMPRVGLLARRASRGRP